MLVIQYWGIMKVKNKMENFRHGVEEMKGEYKKKEESVAMEYAVKQKVVGHELSIMKGTKVR